MEYTAVFIPCETGFHGNFWYDFDEAILFTKEKDLFSFLNSLVEDIGEECNWSNKSILSTKKRLVEGFEVEGLGRVIYPQINKPLT